MTANQLGKRKWLSTAFNLTAIKENRLQWVDYLRGIAILLIVYRHVLIGIQRGQIEVPDVLVDANMIFYSFRMPLFFILSGMFISQSLQKKSISELGWIKFNALIYPYLIWAFIQISLQIAFSGVTNSDRSWVDYTYIFYQPRILDQFWYLPALFNATIIYILLKTKLKCSSTVQILLGVAFYFISPYFQSVSMLSDWMEFYIFFALGDVISKLFFSTRSQNFFRHKYTLLLLTPFFVGAQYYYMKFMAHPQVIITYAHGSRYDYLRNMSDQTVFLAIALIGCMFMIALSFRLQQWKILSFLRVIGYHSLYIYVMHVVITASTRLSLIIMFGITNPLLLMSISITLGVVLPILFYNLAVRNGPAWFLFSYKRRKTLRVAAVKAPVQMKEILMTTGMTTGMTEINGISEMKVIKKM